MSNKAFLCIFFLKRGRFFYVIGSSAAEKQVTPLKNFSMEEKFNVSLQLVVYQSHGRSRTNLEEGLICLNQLPSASLQTACQIRYVYVFFLKRGRFFYVIGSSAAEKQVTPLRNRGVN